MTDSTDSADSTPHLLFAVYSATQALRAGVVEYRTLDGRTVCCTEVGREPGVPDCQWPDKQDLGPVTDFIREVSAGQANGQAKQPPPCADACGHHQPAGSASLGQYNIPLSLDEATEQAAMGVPIDISRLSLSALFHRFTAHNMELDLKVRTIGSRAYVTPNGLIPSSTLHPPSSPSL